MVDCPRISIITPSYNQAEYLEMTIKSAHSQQYPNLEHIVIDGGSTDGSVAIIEKWAPKLAYWVSEPDRGQSDAINKGLRRARGDILGWLNSDDLYEPGALPAVAQCFAEHPDVDVVFGDCTIVDAGGHPLFVRREIPFDFNIVLYGVNYLNQPAVFWRRSVMMRVGLLDESFHHMMDREYWLRMARAACRFHYLPQVLAATRWHPDAKSLATPEGFNRERGRLREMYWNKARFKHRGLHRWHEAALHWVYRVKRQILKARHPTTLNFPGSSFLHYVQARRRRP